MVKKNKNTAVQENPTINENVGAQGNTGVQGNAGVQSNAGIKDNTGVQGNAGTQDNINTNSNIMQDNTVGSVQGNTGMQEDTINGYQTEQNGIVAGQDSQDYPVYQGSSGGQPISGVTTTSNSDLISEQDDFSKQLVSKDLLITIFLSAIGLYIIVSALIYFSSYFIKSKNDNIIEHFFEETFDNNKKKEENQFYMDPSIHKNPQVKRDFNEKEELDNFEKYNIDEFLLETQKLLSKYSHLINLNNLQKNVPKQITSPQGDSEESSKEIPFERLVNPLEFIDYLEFQEPKKKSKTQNVLFLLKKYEEENKPTFSICDLSLQDELSQLVFRGDKNFFGSMSYEDKIILSDNFGEVKFYSIKDKKISENTPQSH